jgi:radical SAM superfamily enzyme YgiQ (UPF0313 family)
VSNRRALLVQLPIPPSGPGALRGNVPLAPGYLKLHAQRTGAARGWEIEILPAMEANQLGDRALVDAILAREPELVGFTCYLWSVDRTLWVAARLRAQRPDLRILVGGPEITADNGWVLEAEAVDWFAIGEGEQTFAELLAALASGDQAALARIPGLARRVDGRVVPGLPRTPLADIGLISSPYLDGILDAADSESLLLETSRGCVFKCRFCYYPKAYDRQYFLAPELVLANLEHARSRGAREVFLLDPTLNQRPDFADFLALLARGNPEQSLEFHGELRGEGITPKVAAAMRRANFAEVEIGLQSIDPHTQELMDRRNNLRAFENGVRALREQGIRTKVDLIVGLPGDTVESVRRGMHWLAERELVDEVQVFQLSILPGTAFRGDAERLGLVHQDRPPYAVLKTPTLDRDAMRGLVEEAEELFATSFDPLPPPWLDFGSEVSGPPAVFDLQPGRLPPERTAQVFTIRCQTADPFGDMPALVAAVRTHLGANPFCTLQVLIETGEEFPLDVVDALRVAMHGEERVYLDRYHEWTPGSPRAARRITVAMPAASRARVDVDWIEGLLGDADLVWSGDGPRRVEAAERSGEWVAGVALRGAVRAAGD